MEATPLLRASMGIQRLVIQEDEDKDLFFDTREDISTIFDSCSSTPAKSDSFLGEQCTGWLPNGPQLEVWLASPGCVRERRENFMRWMGMDHINYSLLSSPDIYGQIHVRDEISPVLDKITPDIGYLKTAPDGENNYLISSQCKEDTNTYNSNDALEKESAARKMRNLDYGAVFIVNGMEQNNSLRSIDETNSSETITSSEFELSSGSSSFFRWLRRRQDKPSCRSDRLVRKKRVGWLRRLAALICIVDRQCEEANISFFDSDKSQITRTSGRVKVRPRRKKVKELSAVYNRQDIKAHTGAILTMKFSPDGQYLATGGADGIVRVWRVMECNKKDDINILDDPSCTYFTVDRNSEVTLHADEDKRLQSNRRRISVDSACVVIPPDVFLLSNEPLHEFHGHQADVLDLAWSTNKHHILSSSKDTIVRLWQVGSNICLKVFPHRNYVTCLHFNPIDENYFISGSIDGKIRIWDISTCRVVNWLDIREIVTAICYRPNGKGVVVGTLKGKCCFCDVSCNNRLQMEARVSLQARKKPPYKQITGIQFCPMEPQILMVTTADSQIRIFNGIDVISKYKGFRSGSQRSASFTADGQHIISASEDCNVYIWNHTIHDAPMPNRVKNIRSRERFFSSNSSIALPWHGSNCSNQISLTSDVHDFPQVCKDQIGGTGYSKCGLEDSCGSNTLYLSSSGSCTLGQEFFSELLPKGSSTWPEEKLPLKSSSSKSDYKFWTTPCRNATSHAWGQVIVTAGRDGWIRTYQNYGLPVHL